jgi:protein-tyrosine phosphatase
MKTTIFLILASLSFSLFAADGLVIGNSFQVDEEGHIFRGKEPKGLVSDLLNVSVSDVLIFKTEVKTEVQDERAALKELGITSHHIPFPWKNFESMEVACEQVVQGLNLIHKVKSQEKVIFFHCTAGEDRTGMLAGLYRMLEEGITQEEAFKNEMCARGYSDGNASKPGMVTGVIQKELTPLFIALAAKIEIGEWTLGKIKKSSCKGLVTQRTKLKCQK